MSSIIVQKPAAPLVTGLSIQSGVKTTTLQWDASVSPNIQYEVWSSPTSTITDGTLVSVQAGNNFAITGLTGTRYFSVRTVNQFGGVGAFAGPVVYTPGTITSADTVGTTPASAALGISSSVASGTIPGYNQFYSFTSASFVAGDNSLINISLMGLTTISNVNVTGAQQLRVYSRISLWDSETNIMVPGTEERTLMYFNMAGIAHGNLSNISNYSKAYVSGFRGLIIPGRSYTIYLSFMKERSFGTPTCSLEVNGCDVTTSSSASF